MVWDSLSAAVTGRRSWLLALVTALLGVAFMVVVGGNAGATLRAAAAGGLPADLQAHVTGGPAFGADIASAFSGANVALLAVTTAVVALLLIARSANPTTSSGRIVLTQLGIIVGLGVPLDTSPAHAKAVEQQADRKQPERSAS